MAAKKVVTVRAQQRRGRGGGGAHSSDRVELPGLNLSGLEREVTAAWGAGHLRRPRPLRHCILLEVFWDNTWLLQAGEPSELTLHKGALRAQVDLPIARRPIYEDAVAAAHHLLDEIDGQRRR